MEHGLLAEHVDAIYGAPREEFTAERDRRARQLRDAGHAEEAVALRRHRRPTVAAWAVDQLARQRSADVGELMTAGEALRDAQRRAVSGASGAGLLQATRRIRELVSRLRAAAREIIEAEGSPPDPHLDEVEQTLFAAAIDPAHHESLRRGVLSSPLQAAGFGDVEGLMLVAAAAEDDRDADQADEAEQADEADEAAAQERRAAEQQRRTRRRELEKRSARLRRERMRQQQRAAQTAEKAEELRARADQAAQDAQEAQGELDRLDLEIDAVLDELDALDG